MLSALGITIFAFDVTPQLISGDLFDAVLIGSYILSVITTILSTVIIVIRILMVSLMPGASRQPQVALEIIVESAALYSISALVYTLMIFPGSIGVTTATYVYYAEVFFAYMAVESHPVPLHPHLLTLYHRTSLPLLSCFV
jgi:hypothetical protein